MPESEEKPKREPREEITRHRMVICDQRVPGGFREAQKKMEFFVQVVGSDKKKCREIPRCQELWLALQVIPATKTKSFLADGLPLPGAVKALAYTRGARLEHAFREQNVFNGQRPRDRAAHWGIAGAAAAAVAASLARSQRTCLAAQAKTKQSKVSRLKGGAMLTVRKSKNNSHVALCDRKGEVVWCTTEKRYGQLLPNANRAIEAALFVADKLGVESIVLQVKGEKDISGWAKETLQEILAEALKDPESSGLVRTPWTFLEVHVLRVEVSGEASLCGRKGQVLLQFDLSLGAELEIKATRSYGADFPRSQHWPRWPAVLRVLGFESGEARPEVQVQFDDPQSEVASEVAWFLHEGLGAKLLQRALDRWRATARRRFAAQEPAASATETTETATSWMSADAMLTASMKRIPHPVRPKKKAVAREPLVKPVAKFVEASLEEAWPAEPSARAERLHQALRARRYAEVFGLLDSPACILNLPVSEEGLSALHSAVLSNSTDMLSLILQARAELAPKDLP
ncbi:ALPHA-ADR [Symbiodinium pilosum]|uniref:ALPHA-ADR protein n=1 Tax=Symbiodinium pilosum TaxID=2952 RepID=A0A812SJE3_SYMPI|nr:ALPHA-ADR [Symbiodinium pilosum]